MTVHQKLSALPPFAAELPVAELASHAPDALSHLIAETSTDAFVAIGCDHRILYWNSGAENMFGWTREEALGETIDMIVPPDLRFAHAQGIERLKHGGKPRLVGKATEIVAHRKDGSGLPVELSLTMWNEPGTDQVAGFAAIIRDISQRKKLEEERNAYASRLEEQLAAIEASSDGIAITDSAGRFLFMNPAHARMFGYADAAAAIGVHWHDLYEPAEVRRLEHDAMPQILAQGSWRGEATGRHIDGRAIEQEVTLSAGANGGLVCTTRDIGERQRALRDRIRTREQLLLAERQETIGRVMSGMVHDFNNLMAVISAAAAALEEHADVEQAHVARIHNAAAAASKLLHKILKPERRTAELQSVDLAATVREVADLVAVSMAPGQVIVVDLPDEHVSIHADESEVMQVLMNLCTNARDALVADAPGEIRLSVELTNGGDIDAIPAVGHAPSGRIALVRVADTGCGIPRGVLDRIFEPFVTSRKSVGTGLGLAVVARLISEAGGAIYVRTSPAGSCFEIAWPLERLETAPAEQDPAPEAVSLAGLTILSVDDNPALLDLIALHLERAGAEVCPCLSPGDGLEVLRDDGVAWDAIVVDYDMPEMNGVDFAGLAHQLRPEVPILLCSAVAEDLVIPATARAHFAAILPKAELHRHLPPAIARIVREAQTGDAA